MNRLSQLVKWIMRAWPFLALVVVALCHYALRRVLAVDDNHIDKAIGAVLQVVGGLIVLYTVNENIGTFRGQTLYSMAIGWLKEFPLIRRSFTLHAQAVMSTAMMSSSVTAHVKRKFNSVEERIEELQRQIDECRQLVHDREKEMRTAIERIKEELRKEISSNSGKISDVNLLLANTVVGGIKTQLFGVLLVVYGAVVIVM